MRGRTCCELRCELCGACRVCDRDVRDCPHSCGGDHIWPKGVFAVPVGFTTSSSEEGEA